ncbi:peptide ligase PGM1-related protein [Streptomyces sp. NPDC000410]|uniref:peptide ligase PGM1-related protein n=1 Tax=Streptomyces sp. NPDC000410 TaxID=3154254 RepID=UPI0033273CC8
MRDQSAGHRKQACRRHRFGAPGDARHTGRPPPHPRPGGNGRPKESERVYEATNSITDPRYAGLRPAQLIHAVTRSPLGYDRARATGVVLHMMSAAAGDGKFGAVCIGADRAEAAALLRGLRELVDDLATGSRRGLPVERSRR